MHKQWQKSECIVGKAGSWNIDAKLGHCTWRAEPFEGNHWLKGCFSADLLSSSTCFLRNASLILTIYNWILLQSFASPMNQVQSRIWLMHWSLFIFFNHDNGRTQIIDLFNQDKYDFLTYLLFSLMLHTHISFILFFIVNRSIASYLWGHFFLHLLGLVL